MNGFAYAGPAGIQVAILLIFGFPFVLIGLVALVVFKGVDAQQRRERRDDHRRGFEIDADRKSEPADDSSAG